jgi:hypothetical protein
VCDPPGHSLSLAVEGVISLGPEYGGYSILQSNNR